MHHYCCKMSLTGTLRPSYWLKSISPLNRVHPWMLCTVWYAVQLNPLNLGKPAHFKRVTPFSHPPPTTHKTPVPWKRSFSLRMCSRASELPPRGNALMLDIESALSLAGHCLAVQITTFTLVKPSHGALPQSAPLTLWEFHLLLDKWQAPWWTCSSVLDVLKSWFRRWIETEKYSLFSSSWFFLFLHNYPLLQSKVLIRA